ncbi:MULTISPECIES: methylenetetrahydrofolate reductase [unclassified Rhodococcus (in: high G+C Gram-positive bacteria)]|uniref:methylenetetrahydrofolate reductase n=1 Tax=unclassified Rhodococcus (in: high G+C Gram-positive bacteria) TaxID=192944 RepID=UPI0009E068EB|nr:MULTISPECIES: methylenetetrahydrofolate reductase [unclassified Rhodococcus (in: high G+C Gram-positive bacteria)]MBY6676003.1 methylenetetrahydrofolate reductase [Rhodococcus sp. BP-332]MBY6686029.1 methylenetetrahydrofolate reductase [Rhodococcus sp. BP-288]MBY6696100.1 methylenetetrahydrofolate reductase [Rhodococcus sp. BP-188]MBY6700697.1 methylenetetrahydrofolate reductase [Rhodococcus sp. BP-285]MBY6703201.1 methylenetetrahydrofolate reductase [Rhodococcus sp. BP-283]
MTDESSRARVSRTPSVIDRLNSAAHGSVPFSVEFSPPRDEAAEDRLWRAVRTFEQMHPAFVSMTYGAGGSTRDRTVRVTGELAEVTNLLPVAHLTAVGHSRTELRAMVGAYADRGISNILVLRGDPPGDPLGPWEKHPDGVEYAEELVRLVCELGDFHVGVASFPEGHHRAPDLDHDTRHLVAKLRAGAEYSITQMFFDVEDYLRLRDRVAAFDPEQGAKPIIPEIMPITSLRSVKRAMELSGSALPASVEKRLSAAAGSDPDENRAAVRAVGIEIATEMGERLIAEGAPGLHFITLNFAKATSEVVGNLGLARPVPEGTGGIGTGSVPGGQNARLPHESALAASPVR